MATGVDTYIKKIKRYISFVWEELEDVKNASSLPPDILQKKEAEVILAKISSRDFLIILDERGMEFNSRAFATEIQKLQISNKVSIVFVIGGAFGFDPSISGRADLSVSLSKLTFTHQMTRLIFAEQLYRVFTILNNEKYHH